VHPFVHTSINLSTHPFFHPFLHPSIRPSTRSSVYLSTRPQPATFFPSSIISRGLHRFVVACLVPCDHHRRLLTLRWWRPCCWCVAHSSLPAATGAIFYNRQAIVMFIQGDLKSPDAGAISQGSVAYIRWRRWSPYQRILTLPSFGFRFMWVLENWEANYMRYLMWPSYAAHV